MDKKIVISQPRYLPSVNYIHRMMIADEFVYLDNVQYTPRDWENRNKINTPNGPIWLSVPVLKVSREQRINETKIEQAENWRTKHLKSIEISYSKTPYFKEVYLLLASVIEHKWETLVELNAEIVSAILKYLGVECRFVMASGLGTLGKGEDLLLEICNKQNATTYISGPLGANYIHPEIWEHGAVKLTYHNYNYPVYKQIHGEFVPWLSVVDLLFNHGPDSKDIINSGFAGLSSTPS